MYKDFKIHGNFRVHALLFRTSMVHKAVKHNSVSDRYC